MAIHFFQEDVDFVLNGKLKIKSWIKEVIKNEGFKLDVINYIFCSDDYLLQVNIDYLNHNYYTDIITFNNSESENIITSDIFISIDRVQDNAKENKVELDLEIKRVLVHGVLHLCGYDDHLDEDVKIMREKEQFYLNKF